MGWRIGFARVTVLASGVALLSSAAATAQIPPSPAEIDACLCLQASYPALASEMNAKSGAYQAANRQLEGLNAQLASERASTNVNNPDAVDRVKALLERRDAASKALQPAYAAAADAVARYNAAVSEYDARCANRPFIPALSPELQARLVCPPGRY